MNEFITFFRPPTFMLNNLLLRAYDYLYPANPVNLRPKTLPICGFVIICLGFDFCHLTFIWNLGFDICHSNLFICIFGPS